MRQHSGYIQHTVTQLYKLIQWSRDSAGDKIILDHVAVIEVLMDAFKTVTEVTSYGATNAKRTWQRMQKEPTPTQANYYSEGRNVRCKT